MTTFAKIVAAVALVALSGAAFAQSYPDHPLTRAEVRQQIVLLEKAGYDPFTSTSQTYPADLRAAERRVQAERFSTSQRAAHDAVLLNASAAQ
ncbi:DUF4148 domain-containing protein [Paraburkholderia acidisoli]|uniref:DUF4148 domain-containing protein n=1 Tax=Paraburkholderia acidisoli TaxID=2571748 RepID=A0A7Z2JHE6_9BURK|nr:DUF4148 domain-containing protein [Paraburkholderia acidisoli]QGZ64671.1 DUF4148 domain-containing protein [Paraburkholderia acidisoli]